MRFEKIKSHAKINLSLNVLGKQKSKLHDLETLVAFVDLALFAPDFFVAF